MPPSYGRFSDLHVDCELCPVHIGRNLRSVGVCPTRGHNAADLPGQAALDIESPSSAPAKTFDPVLTTAGSLGDPPGLLPRRARAPSDRARAKPGV